MNAYTTLLFDSDDTLLDFSRAESESLTKALLEFDINCTEELLNTYKQCNAHMWQAYDRGEIKKSDIYTGRFSLFLRKSGLVADVTALNRLYMDYLKENGAEISGALTLLKKLKAQYKIYIISNGTVAVQKTRLIKSGIINLVDGVFLSEEIGFQKPKIEFFDIVLKSIPEKDKSKILIIGDSITSDIQGGVNAGIDTCLYNPHTVNSEIAPTYSVCSFKDIESLLIKP